MISAVFNGLIYEGFESYKVSRSVEDLSGSFELTFASADPKDPRFWPGDKLSLYVGDTPILTGFIDKRNITWGDCEHLITVNGRDKVCDFVDSTIGANVELKAPVTLDQIIKLLMKEIKMTGVPVKVNVGKLEKFSAGELVSGQVDETLFSFLEKYARKRQVLMTTDGNGGFIISRSGSKQASGQIIHRISAPSKNNVKSAEMDYDNSERFYQYRVWSQGNPASANTLGITTNHSISNRLGVAFDKEIRHTRILDLTAESSSDISVLQRRAAWEANIRRIRSEVYKATLQGHTMTPNGKPWEPNMLVRVIDERAGLDDMLLIKAVEYSHNVGGGSETCIDLVSKDAYLPEPILSHAKKRHGKRGRGERKVYTQKDLEDYLKIQKQQLKAKGKTK